MLRYLSMVTTLTLNETARTGCGMCVAVCPHAVLELDGSKARIVDRDACMECGACARNCPTGAIDVRAGVGCAAAVINEALGRGLGCGCADSDCCS